jgi:hypothetical protein
MNWGQAVKNWGQLAGFAGKAAWGNRTGRGAIIGAGLGAAWGAVSDDTSVLGGAAIGAGLGAVGGRYAGAGFVGARGAGAGMGLGAHAKDYASKFGSSVWGQVRNDFSGAKLAGNRGANAVTTAVNDAVAGFRSPGPKIASNAAVNPISGRDKIRAARSSLLMDRVTQSMMQKRAARLQQKADLVEALRNG